MSVLVRSDAFPVTVGPHTITIRGAYADTWITALCENITTSVIPGMLDRDDVATLAYGLVQGTITEHDIQAAAFEAIRYASGRDWWQAVRLIMSAIQGNAELYGHLVLAGVDPTRITFAAWCSAVFTSLMKNRDTTERAKVEFELMVPPAGIDAEPEGWDTGIPAGFSAELPPGTA